MPKNKNSFVFKCESMDCNQMAIHSILLEDEGLQVYSCESHKTNWTREIKKAFADELYIEIETRKNGFEEEFDCV